MHRHLGVSFCAVSKVLCLKKTTELFLLVIAHPFSLQLMEGGHRGQTGLPVMYAAVAVCRNVRALAQIQPLSMGEPSARACQYRRAPAARCVPVSLRPCRQCGLCLWIC